MRAREAEKINRQHRAGQGEGRGQSTSADVIPVGVLGGHLLVDTGLHKVDPRGELEPAALLKVGSIGRDELVSGDVFKGHSLVGHGGLSIYYR